MFNKELFDKQLAKSHSADYANDLMMRLLLPSKIPCNIEDISDNFDHNGDEKITILVERKDRFYDSIEYFRNDGCILIEKSEDDGTITSGISNEGADIIRYIYFDKNKVAEIIIFLNVLLLKRYVIDNPDLKTIQAHGSGTINYKIPLNDLPEGVIINYMDLRREREY